MAVNFFKDLMKFILVANFQKKIGNNGTFVVVFVIFGAIRMQKIQYLKFGWFCIICIFFLVCWRLDSADESGLTCCLVYVMAQFSESSTSSGVTNAIIH